MVRHSDGHTQVATPWERGNEDVLERLAEVRQRLLQVDDVGSRLGDGAADARDVLRVRLVVLDEHPQLLQRVVEDEGSGEQAPHERLARAPQVSVFVLLYE